MTHTHLSHFGLTEIGRTNTGIVFQGTLANCRRLAFAHGLEVAEEGYRILSSSCGRAIYDTTTVVIFILSPGGLIHRTRDGWALVLPLKDWNKAV